MPSLHKPPKGLYYRQDCPHSIFLTDLLLGHCWKLVPRTPAVFPSGSLAVWLLPVGSLMFVTLLVIAPTSWWVNSLASIQSSVLSFACQGSNSTPEPRAEVMGEGCSLACSFLVNFLTQLRLSYLACCHHSGEGPSLSISKQGGSPQAGQCIQPVLRLRFSLFRKDSMLYNLTIKN